MYSEKVPVEQICRVCQKPFHPWRAQLRAVQRGGKPQRYCSQQCHGLARRGERRSGQEFTCLGCGATFWRRQSRVKETKQRGSEPHYCSLHCYRAKGRKDRTEYLVTYRLAHHEQMKLKARTYAAAHREERNTYRRRWRAERPDLERAAKARHSARVKGLPATLTTDQWQAIKRAYRYRCAYCGKKESKKRLLTQDHVTPLSKGGGTTADNIVPACGSCNSRKQAGPPPLIPAIRLLV